MRDNIPKATHLHFVSMRKRKSIYFNWKYSNSSQEYISWTKCDGFFILHHFAFSASNDPLIYFYCKLYQLTSSEMKNLQNILEMITSSTKLFPSYTILTVVFIVHAIYCSPESTHFNFVSAIDLWMVLYPANCFFFFLFSIIHNINFNSQLFSQ